MSDQRICTTCGMTFETGWGDDAAYCNYCDDTTSYAPTGLDTVSEGDRVSHLYFTGIVSRITARSLDDEPRAVEVQVEQSSWNDAGGYVTIDTKYLSPA